MRRDGAQPAQCDPRRAAFCRSVHAMAEHAGVTIRELGQALRHHRQIVDGHSAAVIAQRLLDVGRWDVRITLDDLAAWERVLPGVVQVYLTTYGLGLDVVAHQGQAADERGLVRAVATTFGSAGELAETVTRALDDGALSNAEARAIRQAGEVAIGKIRALVSTAEAMAPKPPQPTKGASR